MHHVKLCEEIVNNWSDIEAIYKTSSFSFTRPKLTGLRAANPRPFKDFIRRGFLASYPYTFELKTDIAKYYPSIYTHSKMYFRPRKRFAAVSRWLKRGCGTCLFSINKVAYVNIPLISQVNYDDLQENYIKIKSDIQSLVAQKLKEPEGDNPVPVKKPRAKTRPIRKAVPPKNGKTAKSKEQVISM